MIPQSVVLFSSYRCDSRCVMCSAWTKQEVSPELSVGQIEKIFSDRLLRDNIEIVNLTGGEPTLREDMVDIVKALLRQCHKLQRLDVPTNGIDALRVLDKIERTLAVILPTSVKVCVTVSVDGLGDVHDKVRGTAGAFCGVEKTIEGLKELAELYPYMSLSLNATISRFNVRDLPELRAFAKSYGVGINYTLAALSEIGVESVAKNGTFEVDADGNRVLVDFLQELVGCGEIRKFDGEFMIRWLHTGTRSASCNFARGKVILIEPSGDAYACGNFKQFFLGNVVNEAFGSLWKRKKTIPGKAVDKCRVCNSNCYLD